MTLQSLEDINYSSEFFLRKPPAAYRYFIFIISGLFIAAVVWASFFEMDIAVKADAILTQSVNISVGKIGRTGVIDGVYFTPNTAVEKDSILLSIESTSIQLDKTITEDALQRQKQELAALLLYEKAILTDSNTVPRQESIAYAKAAVYFAEKEKARILYEQAKDVFLRQKAMPEQMRTEQMLNKLHDEYKIAELQYTSFREKELLAVHTQKNALQIQIENLEKKQAELEQQLTAGMLTAPISGIAEPLKKFNTGDTVFAGDTLVRIVPDTAAQLKAELSISNKDIAEIRIGMPITLKFAALPPAEYGLVQGTITSISADALFLPNAPAFFTAEAVLEKDTVTSKQRKTVALKSGMAAEAKIITARKRILTVILEKLDFIS